jgi:hypothetical protein
MRQSNWLHALGASRRYSNKRRARSAKLCPTRARRPQVEPLEERTLLATLTVNSSLDNNIPGDGLVTLREAIIAANANTTTDLGQTGSGADTIQFDSVAFATPAKINLVFGEMTVSQSLSINGPGRSVLTIDGQQKSRIFNVATGTRDVSISDISLVRGRVVDPDHANGGAISSGAGNLRLERVSITESSVVTGDGDFDSASGGGLIAGGSSLTIISSTISGNSVTSRRAAGGGIASGAKSVTITDSIIGNNTVTGPEASGGGISAAYSRPPLGGGAPDLTLTGTTIADNVSTSTGGGISVNGGLIVGGLITRNRTTGTASGSGGGGIYSTGDLTVRETTVHANHSASLGGGIRSGGLIVDSTVSANTSMAGGGGVDGGFITVTNSTISNNTTAGDGGGIRATARATLNHATVTDNHSTAGRAGGVIANNIEVRAFSSIIAGNTAANGNPDLSSGTGTFILNYSLIGDALGTTLAEAQTPDVNGNLIGHSTGSGIIDPKLGPLTDNGGPTATHALLAGSPAIDANNYQPLPSPVRSYQLNASLAEAQGGPPLVALGGTLNSFTGRYEFGPNQGLNMTGALSNPRHYSLELVFRWNDLSGGWQKIIDFYNLGSNGGLYTAVDGLHFWNGPFTPNLFEADTDYHLVLTRDDTTDIVRVFLDGVLVLSFTDTAGDAVFGVPSQIIRLFQDDTITGQAEAQSGTVDLIRVYDAALTGAQIFEIENPIALPIYDQRGVPFSRVQDSNGVGGAQIDMGAYELQGTRPTVDFGDAPDTAAGTGIGNYNTLASDDGPRHTINSGLRIGAVLDGDSGTLQNPDASADDVDGALPDDEDGLSHAAVDLLLTIGMQPTVNVYVTNTSNSSATLYGWIDYNANGMFDNATERAAVAVSSGTAGKTVTLVFPTVPPGFTGETYARFRLSTDPAAANPTGAAADGEVEDTRATIHRPGMGVADDSKNKKIASETGVGPPLSNGGLFGSAVAPLGDIDGDGVNDLAVGAPRGGAGFRGAVYVLLMNSDGTVKASKTIASGIGGGPTLGLGEYFGHSIAPIGDLDGDGIPDLAVGADHGRTDGINPAGTVYLLFMNSDGLVKRTQKIEHNLIIGPVLNGSDRFGSSITSLGDLDGDGNVDLAVGASGDGSSNTGAVHVIFLNPDSTVKATQKISSDTGGGPLLAAGDEFGSGLALVGDLDGDGVSELAVGASGLSGNSKQGAVHVLFMNSNGTVKYSQKITTGVNGGPTLASHSYFGRSVASLGDLDGDGVTDLAVGAYGDATSGFRSGAVYIMYLHANGTAKNFSKIASGTNGGPTLVRDDRFGSSATLLGDLDGDGVIDLAIGAETEETNGSRPGAVHVLFLKPAAPVATALAGDYTSDGTVDVTDYVVWRNALGSAVMLPNDSTPGTVTQADYDVWRANFGHSLVAVAEARVLADASQPTVAGSQGEASFEPLVARDSYPIVDPSVLPHREFSPPSSRAAAGRPTPRSAFGHDSARDEALIAWLASRHIEPDPGSRAWELANTMPETTPNDRIEQPSDVLALALAAL